MRRFIASIAVGGVLVTTALTAAPARAAHFCALAMGTFVSVALPANPADPSRTQLYIWDRSHQTPEGTRPRVYLENGLQAGFQPFGVHIAAPGMGFDDDAPAECDHVRNGLEDDVLL